MRITDGEALWLVRRREGATQAGFLRWALSEDALREAEHDRLPLGAAEVASLRLLLRRAGPLTPGEFAALARRRKGWTLPRLARARRTSRQTLVKQEHDRTATAPDLARWWARAYPAPAAPARVAVAGPDGFSGRASGTGGRKGP